MEGLEKPDELWTGRAGHPGGIVDRREVGHNYLRLEAQPMSGGPDGILSTVR